MKIDRFTLFLDGFETEAEIGIHDFERGRRQRMRIDIALTLAPDSLAGTDELDDTLDYDFLREEIAALVAHRRFNLQETLAREIVALIARRAGVEAGTVRVCKPDVYPDAEAIGCELAFSRR